MESILIVGSGQAGVQIAVSLRELGYRGRISLVGSEPHAPYQRPPLSKAFLVGDAEASSLELRNVAFYVEHGIDVHVSERVISVDHDGYRGTATTDCGRTLTFDGLALATGVRPRRLTVPGADARGVHYLRTLDDAATLRRALSDHERGPGTVAVVGGGFIGLEIAAACRARGIGATVIETAPRVMARAVSPEMSTTLERAHQETGARILLGSTVEEVVTSDGQVSAVRTEDGQLIECGVVVVGIGSLPRTELAEQLGLRCDNGIVVDEACRTSVPSIVAAGDCSVFQPAWAPRPVRLESVPNATDQGRIAAAALLGIKPAPQPPPWFWSDQGALKLQLAGWTAESDRRVVRRATGSAPLSIVHYVDERMVGVEALNSPHDFSAVKRALVTGDSFPPEAVGDVRVHLKDLLATTQR